MNAGAQKGFTLIEFIMALAVAAVLLTLAVPTFGTVTMNKRITAQTNDFISTLALARAEALKRVSRVTVCRSANGTACAVSGGWEQGWIVFADDDNDATRDNGEDILRFRSALEGGNTLRGSSNVANYISYVASGTTKLTSGGLQAGTLALCDERGAGENARAITINATGRARVEYTGPVACMP
jgi:type IV fimbrial biogenesis protein FimT